MKVYFFCIIIVH